MYVERENALLRIELKPVQEQKNFLHIQRDQMGFH
jgi:hypothetical protein